MIDGDDTPITIQQVIVTIVLGALVGLFISGLCLVASPTFREHGWVLTLAAIGACAGVALWIRYASSWIPLWPDWF